MAERWTARVRACETLHARVIAAAEADGYDFGPATAVGYRSAVVAVAPTLWAASDAGRAWARRFGLDLLGAGAGLTVEGHHA